MQRRGKCVKEGGAGEVEREEERKTQEWRDNKMTERGERMKEKEREKMDEQNIKRNVCKEKDKGKEIAGHFSSFTFSLHLLVSVNENHNPSKLTATAQRLQHHLLFLFKVQFHHLSSFFFFFNALFNFKQNSERQLTQLLLSLFCESKGYGVIKIY